MNARARILLTWPITFAVVGLAGLALTDRLGLAPGLAVGVALGLVAGTVVTMWADR